jgi:hypothetical protein
MSRPCEPRLAADIGGTFTDVVLDSGGSDLSIFCMIPFGGGGPLHGMRDRDAAAVLQDVHAGLVSQACAGSEYGVVVQEGGGFSESHARRARRQAAA